MPHYSQNGGRDKQKALSIIVLEWECIMTCPLTPDWLIGRGRELCRLSLPAQSPVTTTTTTTTTATTTANNVQSNEYSSSRVSATFLHNAEQQNKMAENNDLTIEF